MRQGGTISGIKRFRKIYRLNFEIFRSFLSTKFLKSAVIINQGVCVIVFCKCYILQIAMCHFGLKNIKDTHFS